jgi:hypothetical protein
MPGLLHHQPRHEAHDQQSVHKGPAARLPEYQRVSEGSALNVVEVHTILLAANEPAAAGGLHSTLAGQASGQLCMRSCGCPAVQKGVHGGRAGGLHPGTEDPGSHSTSGPEAADVQAVHRLVGGMGCLGVRA